MKREVEVQRGAANARWICKIKGGQRTSSYEWNLMACDIYEKELKVNKPARERSAAGNSRGLLWLEMQHIVMKWLIVYRCSFLMQSFEMLLEGFFGD